MVLLVHGFYGARSSEYVPTNVTIIIVCINEKMENMRRKEMVKIFFIFSIIFKVFVLMYELNNINSGIGLFSVIIDVFVTLLFVRLLWNTDPVEYFVDDT